MKLCVSVKVKQQTNGQSLSSAYLGAYGAYGASFNTAAQSSQHVYGKSPAWPNIYDVLLTLNNKNTNYKNTNYQNHLLLKH